MARKRMKRGSKIDFAQVKSMLFKTYAYMCIGSEVEIELENGMLELRRGFSEHPDSVIPITPALADKLTQLFETCGVTNWKRHYEPEPEIRVLDGEGWDLTLTLKDESIFKVDGSNAWPDEFDMLKNGLMELFDS